MGRPNFQRLAELGQLPDYIEPTVNEALAQVSAMNKEKKEMEIKEDVAEVVVEEKKHRGRPKKEVVEEIKEESILEDLERENKGEFVDDILT